MMSTDISNLLDSTETALRGGEVSTAMNKFAGDLTRLRRSSSDRDWRNSCRATRDHPVHKLILEDPYSRRAFEKPRGYAGDAAMLDFIYDGVPPEGTSELGKAIFAETTRHTNALSVLERADRIAAEADRLAHRPSPFSALSVGCGYMREVDRMKDVERQNVSAFVGLDQDEHSVEVARRRLSQLGGTVEKLSVTSLLRQKMSRAKFDLIYASGIFDYLKDDLARSLASALVDLLAVDGKLIIANYTPESDGRAYMEAVMDWTLIYRSEDELENLMPRAKASFENSISMDSYGNIVYFETVRLR